MHSYKNKKDNFITAFLNSPGIHHSNVVCWEGNQWNTMFAANKAKVVNYYKSNIGAIIPCSAVYTSAKSQ